MRNKLIIGLLALVLISMPVTTTSQSGWGVYAADVYGQVIGPLPYAIDYNAETKIVQINFFEPDIYEPGSMTGLEVIELLFNTDVKPTDISAVYVNGTNIMDMLKNFTLIDNVHFWMEGEGVYYDASYLLAYIYVYPDHTIINEHWSDLQFQDRLWVGGPNDNSPQNDTVASLSLAGDGFSLSDTQTNVYVNLDFNENVTTTTTTPTNNNLLLISGSVGLVIMAIVIVVWFGRKQA